jgi:hypothetical protein
MIAIQREVYYPKTQGKQKEFHHGMPKLKTTKAEKRPYDSQNPRVNERA